MLQSPDFNQINTAEGPVGVFNYPHECKWFQPPHKKTAAVCVNKHILKLFTCTRVFLHFCSVFSFTYWYFTYVNQRCSTVSLNPRTAPCPSFPLVTWLHLLLFVYTTFILFFLLLNLHFSNPLKCILYMHYGSHNLVPQKHSCFRVLMKYNGKKKYWVTD